MQNRLPRPEVEQLLNRYVLVALYEIYDIIQRPREQKIQPNFLYSKITKDLGQWANVLSPKAL